ncbi:Proline--tRNA ligase [compost metagenome]
MNLENSQMIKALAFEADGKPIVVLVRGDYELSETKIKHFLGARTLDLLTEEKVIHELHSEPGFIGPVGLHEQVLLLADHSVSGMQEAVAGSNEKDFHLFPINPSKDLKDIIYADLRNITEADPCPRCSQPLTFTKGIEVGHVFKLGTAYSKKLSALYLNENGKEQPMIMGCYGIGVSRTLAAVIEQHHDEAGLVWPLAIAPFQIHLITINLQDQLQAELSNQLYLLLKQQGLDVLWDDRDERPGVKFKDADLLGFPLRITVGKKASEQIVECKIRKSGTMLEITVQDLLSWVQKFLLQGGI